MRARAAGGVSDGRGRCRCGGDRGTSDERPARPRDRATARPSARRGGGASTWRRGRGADVTGARCRSGYRSRPRRIHSSRDRRAAAAPMRHVCCCREWPRHSLHPQRFACRTLSRYVHTPMKKFQLLSTESSRP